jgi:hypothetical protein
VIPQRTHGLIASAGCRWTPHVAYGWRRWTHAGAGLGSLGGSFSTVPASQVPQLISSAAQQYGVSPQLALQVATQESGLQQTVVSPAGAIGVMQLEPGTAGDLSVNPYDTAQNIDGGVRYLSQLLQEFNGNQAEALAAYNAGPGTVNNALSSGGSDWLSNLPAETQNYVSSILNAIGGVFDQANVTPVSDGQSTAVLAGTLDGPTTALLLAFGLALAYLLLG